MSRIVGCRLMIFISYSHSDRTVCEEFVTMVAPLTRYGGVKLWSDADIQPGKKWQAAIDKAMKETSVAVLLVSKAFLASRFIQTKELPYFLEAAEKRGVEFMWVCVSDCMWEETPLAHIQAVNGTEKPLDQYSVPEQQTLLKMVGKKVHEAWKRYERPEINRGLNGHKVFREEPNFHVLAKPARRRTEVFVFSEGVKEWWHVGSILPGGTHCKCYFGGEKTPASSTFKLLAVTTDQTVGGMMEPPKDRTQSEEASLKRK